MYEQAILATRQQSWEQSYPGTADQLRHVRSAIRGFLGSCPVVDDAVYLLSELCANAVVHTDSGKDGSDVDTGSPDGDPGIRCGDDNGKPAFCQVTSQVCSDGGKLLTRKTTVTLSGMTRPLTAPCTWNS